MVSRPAPFTLLTTVSCFMILVKIASCFKVSYLIGSYAAFFSASAMVQPLVGFFGGLAGSGMVLVAGLALRYFLHALSFKILVYHIPSFCAAAYWASDHWGIRLALPMLCIVLFVAHPQGFSAAPYALYWLIPIFLQVKNYRSAFATALGSTFIAHGVGSVIWLYTVPMAATTWLLMIPLVALERLVIAVGMTGMYYCLERLTIAMQQVVQRLLVTRIKQC